MTPEQIKQGLKTPLINLGELPPELFLSCLAGVPAALRGQVVKKWSAQLHTSQADTVNKVTQ